MSDHMDRRARSLLPFLSNSSSQKLCFTNQSQHRAEWGSWEKVRLAVTCQWVWESKDMLLWRSCAGSCSSWPCHMDHYIRLEEQHVSRWQRYWFGTCSFPRASKSRICHHTLQKQKLLLLLFAFLLVPLLSIVLWTQVVLGGGLFVLYTEEWRNSGSEGDARGRRGVTSWNNILFFLWTTNSRHLLGIKQWFNHVACTQFYFKAACS